MVVGLFVVDGAGHDEVDSAHKITQRKSLSCKRTLALLCDAVRDGLLTAELVSDIVDDLVEPEYRLPFAPGEFIPWTIEQQLLPRTDQ